MDAGLSFYMGLSNFFLPCFVFAVLPYLSPLRISDKWGRKRSMIEYRKTPIIAITTGEPI